MDERLKNEDTATDNVLKTSSQPREAILSFMAQQFCGVKMVPSYDVHLLCDGGSSVQVHRLTLAAMSPLLARAMNNDAEEPDYIHVDGATLSALQEMVNILYKGGTPSPECESVMSTLCISPAGIPSTFTLNPHIQVKLGGGGVKEEPQVDLQDVELDNDVDAQTVELDDYKYNASNLNSHEKSLLSELREYFEPVSGGMQRCTLCEEITRADTETMVDHFSNHHEELDRIGEGTSRKKHRKPRPPRSRVWKYFEKEQDNKAYCMKCGLSVKITMGSTTMLIYHLRTKHEDDYAVFEGGEEEEEPDVLEELEMELNNKKKKSRNRRSKIWFYFSKAEEGVAECNECGKQIQTAKQAKGSTSGLIHHLKHFHPQQFSVFESIKTVAIDKDEFSEISNSTGGVKVEDALPKPRVKKIKKEKGEKKLKKKKRERILNYYTTVSEGWAACNECKENVSMDHGSTSMMVHHLKLSHPHVFKSYEGSSGTKPELVMCEYCSETYDKQKMLQHNFTNHFDNWMEGAKVRFAALRNKLIGKYRAGPYFKNIKTFFTINTLVNTVTCKFCDVTLPDDSAQMDSHIKCSHPEGELPEDMSLSCWILGTPRNNKIHCNLCQTMFSDESVFSSHIPEAHKAEHLDLLDWEDVLPSPGDPLSFKVGVLLEKYEKTFNYWENTPKISTAEYGKLDDPVFRTCCECRKVFSTGSAMRYHQRVVHSGDKPFKCDMCEKAFNRKDTLESHLSSHSDLKPFMCSVCGKQFGRRHIRDTHERRHKGEKKYACNMCVKRFMSSQQLKNHIRVHTGEKPFSCEHCGRMFAVKHQLITHLRIHTGERPYGCAKCDQKFKHLSTRRNHKCVGDLKHHPHQEAVDVRDALYRIPIPQAYHTGP